MGDRNDVTVCDPEKIPKTFYILKTFHTFKIIINPKNNKMQNDPNYPIRKYNRLRGFDYSNTGFYFITINIQSRLCLFGTIVNGKMILNDAGHMIEKWYYELENKFPNTRCHEMVVMPDHFHCIIENVMVAHVGAPLRGRPLPNHQRPLPNNEHKNPKTNYGIDNKKTTPPSATPFVGLKQ